MSEQWDWSKIHEELGAENKAQSDRAEARGAERTARQITAGLRDSAGKWIDREDGDEDEDEDEGGR